ncbi:MAG: cytochrome c3 family protein [bacterium]
MKLPVRSSILVVVAAISFCAGICTLEPSAAAQRRKPKRAPAPRKSTSSIDYSHFSHATKKHQGACNTCHQVPTSNWQKTKDFPDVADFPGHDACVSCHRAQFFKGAKPTICSDCHRKVSPRDDARFAFRNPARARQFLIEFPHDKHQDVIAKLLRKFESDRTPRFVHAMFKATGPFADEKTKHYNNCEICHQPRAAAPAAPATGWPDAFAPAPDTFKLAPLSHASCFNCHWQGQPPVNDNCAGCHKLAAQPYVWLDSPQRISLKFRHGREQHVAECTTCHIHITKSATLRGLKPDVPITACSECHNKDGLRLDVSKELVAIDKDHGFTCTYCHTSDVGKRDAPASHYLISGMQPKKR